MFLSEDRKMTEVIEVKSGRVRLKHDTGETTSWSYPDERFSEVAWRLRYAGTMGPELTMADRMLAAEVMSNYADIITHPAASLRVTPSTVLARHYRKMRREKKS